MLVLGFILLLIGLICLGLLVLSFIPLESNDTKETGEMELVEPSSITIASVDSGLVENRLENRPVRLGEQKETNIESQKIEVDQQTEGIRTKIGAFKKTIKKGKVLGEYFFEGIDTTCGTCGCK